MSEELLPCPFCGSTDIDSKGWMSSDGCGGYETGPACMDCAGSTESVKRWNQRPIADLDGNTIATLTHQALSQQEQIETLLAVLKDAQRIIERDFPNGQLVIDIRSALNGGCACTSVDRSHCQEIDCQSNHVTPAKCEGKTNPSFCKQPRVRCNECPALLVRGKYPDESNPVTPADPT